jgi:hypothetical protein
VVVIPDLTHILVISNTNDDNAWIQSNFPIHMNGFDFVTWNFRDSVPSVQQLNQFDAVLLFENGTEGPICDSVGDQLHDYVMSGGNLVIGTFYWQERSDGGYEEVGWGDLESIDPLFANEGNAYNNDSTGTWINHPLTRGLDTIYCHYGGGYDSLRSGTTAVAWWKNGEILMAYNAPNGRIVAVTLWPAEPNNRAGNYKGFYRAWENALLYSAWGNTRTDKTNIVTAPWAVPANNLNKENAGSERPVNGGSGKR